VANSAEEPEFNDYPEPVISEDQIFWFVAADVSAVFALSQVNSRFCRGRDRRFSNLR
jgi:prophage antirepressor-like protein